MKFAIHAANVFQLNRIRTAMMAFALTLSSAAVVSFETASPAFAETTDYSALGYLHASAPCQFGVAGGASCTNPNNADDKYDWYVDENGNGSYSGTSENHSERGYFYRNCTDYVAWKLESLGISSSLTRGRGNGKQWDDDATGVTITATPEIGDAAVWNSGDFGHVAFVEAVRPKSGGGYEVKVSEYNHDTRGNGNTRYWVQADSYVDFNGVGTPLGGACPEGNFLKVKRTNGPDAVRQVYAATASCVFETWWVPGVTGPQTSRIIRIAQDNIVDFDKINLPNGVQSLYTAVPDGIWETNWTPGAGPSSAKIITLPNVKKVIAETRTSNGQLTHLLYVLAADGPYEFWWQDGGDGIHHDRLANINGPVAFVKATQPDGTEQVFTANAGAVFETRWHPGTNDKSTREMIYISQLGIVDITKHNQPDGSQLLYTATKDNGVWQTYWASPASQLHHGLLVNSLPGIKKIEKHVYNGVHQLYAATSNRVQEYWWHSGGSGGSTIVNTSNTADFDKTTDGSFQQIYTTDGPNVVETWWGAGQGPTSAELDVNQQS